MEPEPLWPGDDLRPGFVMSSMWERLAQLPDVARAAEDDPEIVAVTTAAEERWVETAEKQFLIGFVIFVVALVLLFALLVVIYGQWVSSDRDYGGTRLWASLAPVVSAALVALSLWCLFRHNEPPAKTASTLKKRLMIGLRIAQTLVGAVAGLSAIYLFFGPYWPGGNLGRWGALGLLFGLLLAIALCGFLAVSISQAVRPQDVRRRLIVSLAEAVAVSHYKEMDPYGSSFDLTGLPMYRSWRVDEEERQAFVRRLERIVVAAERDTVRLAPWSARSARSELRMYGRRVAAGFNRLACDVALGGGNDERVVKSLISSYVAACRGRWDELARNDPAPIRARVAEVIIARVGTLVILAGAGLLIGELSDHSPLGLQVQWSLVGAAVLAAVSPRGAFEEARAAVVKAVGGR